MAAHRKRGKLVPLAVVLSVLVVAAVGGYALAGSHAPETVNLASAPGASGQHVTVTACLASGKFTRVSVAAAARCPVRSAPVHWAAQSSAPGASSQHVTVTACLASGKFTRVSVAAAARCPVRSAPVHWAAQSAALLHPHRAPLPRPLRPGIQLGSAASPSPGIPATHVAEPGHH